MRRGRALRVDIEGRDHLSPKHADVMLESGDDLVQVHLKASPSSRISIITPRSPLPGRCWRLPAMRRSCSANRCGRRRIPLFEQAVVVQGRARVSMAWATRPALLALRSSRRMRTPTMHPAADGAGTAPAGEMRHLRLHNGVIWRWNRPLIGFDLGRDAASARRASGPCQPAEPDRDDRQRRALCRPCASACSKQRRRFGGLPFAAAREEISTRRRGMGLDAQLTYRRRRDRRRSPAAGTRPAP